MIPEKSLKHSPPLIPRSLHPFPWVVFDTPQADPAQKLVKIRPFSGWGGGPYK